MEGYGVVGSGRCEMPEDGCMPRSVRCPLRGTYLPLELSMRMSAFQNRTRKAALLFF